MAAHELWDYLDVVTPDYWDGILTVIPQNTIVEESEKNQAVHRGDDNSEEIISFSDDSIFYVVLQWDVLSASDAGTIFDYYHDSTKANGRARSFRWTHYGETEQYDYTVRFASALPRSIRPPASAFKHSFSQVKLRVLGRAPDIRVLDTRHDHHVATFVLNTAATLSVKGARHTNFVEMPNLDLEPVGVRHVHRAATELVLVT